MQPLAAVMLDKVFLKAVNRKNLKEVKTFMMRDVNTAFIHSLGDLKALIRENFCDDIRRDFDVGYAQGTNVIRVRSKEDLSEMWSEIRRSKGSTCLWCDGLIIQEKSDRKRKSISDDEDLESSGKSKRRKKHQENLKMKRYKM